MELNPVDATVIPLSRARRKTLSMRPQEPVTQPSSGAATDQTGLLFEVPQAPSSRPRTASSSGRSTKPRKAADPDRQGSKPRKPALPPKPSRPALRTANSDDELCEGMKRTRRVRVTFDADVHSATFYDERLTIVLELPTGERVPICPEDIGALVEVIEKDGEAQSHR